MNFTREPIIETIISPKEGYKLVIRSSKGGTHEEYVVDALEVVSFGHSFFYRCLERPKSFLVPVSDYEVIEAKETRVVLKNVNIERAIKIAGGKESKTSKAQDKQSEQEPAAVEKNLEKKRERRRHRRRRLPSEDKEAATKEETSKSAKDATEGGGADDETKKVSSSIIRKLIPPPTKLISAEELKAKIEPAKAAEGDVLPEPVEEVKKPRKRVRRKKAETPKAEKETPEEPTKEEAPKEEKAKEETPKEPSKEEAPKEEKPQADSSESSGEMQRTAIEEPQPVGSSTSFSALPGESDFSSFGKI